MSNRNGGDPRVSRLASAIAKQVGHERFSIWFGPGKAQFVLTHHGLEIVVPDDLAKERISQRFMAAIHNAVSQEFDRSLSIEFIVDPHACASGEEMLTPVEAEVKPLPIPKSAKPVCVLQPEPSSVPQLMFDLSTFVVGRTNQGAYDMALSVVATPGVRNPLFIYGPCGVGKTHLLQGLCHVFKEQHPAKLCLYMTAEEFTREFLQALRRNCVEDFRRKVRGLDLFVIDDVQFLGDKKATQLEFEQTLNAIMALGRQIVLSANCSPEHLEGFEEGLLGRFGGGAVVRIDPPTKAMRSEILRRLCTSADLEIDEDVISWIAERVTRNVRELEGVVTRLAEHVKLPGNTLDAVSVRRLLDDFEQKHTAPLDPDKVIVVSCQYFGLERRDVCNGRRYGAISLARSMAMYLIRDMTGLSFPEIGQRFAGRTHSTVISAHKRIRRSVESNEILTWKDSTGDRAERARDVIEQLREHSQSLS